jgi:hypothetical protein
LEFGDARTAGRSRLAVLTPWSMYPLRGLSNCVVHCHVALILTCDMYLQHCQCSHCQEHNPSLEGADWSLITLLLSQGTQGWFVSEVWELQISVFWLFSHEYLLVILVSDLGSMNETWKHVAEVNFYAILSYVSFCSWLIHNYAAQRPLLHYELSALICVWILLISAIVLI